MAHCPMLNNVGYNQSDDCCVLTRTLLQVILIKFYSSNMPRSLSSQAQHSMSIIHSWDVQGSLLEYRTAKSVGEKSL